MRRLPGLLESDVGQVYLPPLAARPSHLDHPVEGLLTCTLVRLWCLSCGMSRPDAHAIHVLSDVEGAVCLLCVQ